MVTGNIVTVGSAATMRCTVNLSEFVSCSSGPVTVSLQLVRQGGGNKGAPVVAVMSETTCGGDLMLPSSATVDDAGQYLCRATVNYTGVNDDNVEEPSVTDSGLAFLYVVGQC